MDDRKKQINQIDKLLPQTQCQLCDYSGCRPYAVAIVDNNETINRCLPGGLNTLFALAEYLNQDPTPLLDEMKKKVRPAMHAIIDENTCIGCTKCLPVCPTDAIIGSAKSMHTVLVDACTGCGLCLPPCPMDCITLSVIPEATVIEKKENAIRWRERHQKRNQRLRDIHLQQYEQHQAAKLSQSDQQTLSARKKAIQESLIRVAEKKAKRNSQ